MKLDALFLDFGGTLALERASRAALYCRAAADHGLVVDEDVMAAAMARAHDELPREIDGAFRYTDDWFRAYIAHVFGGLGFTGGRAGLERDLFALFSDARNFAVFPDVPGLLERARDLRVAVVSNWGERLEPLLDGLGLRIDLALTSALEGVEKPDPAIFERALDGLGVQPQAVLHVGDRADTDVVGAQAVGIDVVLLDRSGRMCAPAGAHLVRSLDEVQLP